MQLRKTSRLLGVGLLLATTGTAVSAQNSDIAAPCMRLGPTAPAAASEWCIQAAQAASSAQPQLGILIAAGNPLLGAGRAGSGFRLGILPQASITGKLSLAGVRLPEIRASQPAGGADFGEVEFVAPALTGTAMVGLLPGVNLAPTAGGVGSVDLIAQATYLPFETFNTPGLGERSPDLAYGLGARIGIVRESFVLPGVSVSGMYRRLGKVAFGNVCQGTVQITTRDFGQAYTFEEGLCVAPSEMSGVPGDPGEFAFDLSNTSVRAVVSKRRLPVGIAAGIGYDQWQSHLAFGFRAPNDPRFFRASDVDLSSGLFSAFANGVLTLPFVSFALEVGWLGGGDNLAGFDAGRSEFDPTSGIWFGSMGVRLSL